MNGDKIMFEINGHTKQLGIIGYPVEHTFSPEYAQLHIRNRT